MIGSQANNDAKTKIKIHFYKIILCYEKYSTLNLYSYRIKKIVVLYKAVIMAGLPLITLAL